MFILNIYVYKSRSLMGGLKMEGFLFKWRSLISQGVLYCHFLMDKAGHVSVKMSQTGLACGSFRLDIPAKHAKAAGIDHVDYSFQQRLMYFQAKLIHEAVVVFVVATTGQGDPPENMKVCQSGTNPSFSYVL